MTEVERIQDQIRRGFTGPAWHGSAVGEVLAGVRASTAVRRPLPSIHTIWELALHMTVWRNVVVRRIEGEHTAPLSPQEDWPQRADETEEAWQWALRELNASQDRLLAAVASMPDARLDDVVPDHEYTFYVMLHGIVQHDLYHAGQIALVKKLLALE